MGESDYPFVSVIIPVFNDAERLQICLNALAQQRYPQSRYEVIVTDNDSDDAAQVQAVVGQFPFAIATDEATPSSYAARNQGLSLAKGEVIINVPFAWLAVFMTFMSVGNRLFGIVKKSLLV